MGEFRLLIFFLLLGVLQDVLKLTRKLYDLRPPHFAVVFSWCFSCRFAIIREFLVVEVHVLVDFVQKVQIRFKVQASFLTGLHNLLLKVLLRGCRFVRHLLMQVS